MKRLRISAVSDVTFGVHRDRAVEGLDHDFLCVLGPNESGKSTLAEFLQWMIAGPGGDTASAARFGDPTTRVGGRLLGSLAGEALELDARFTLKKNGVPNDTRQGHLGDRVCDGASLAALFGGLTAADYRLIHRLRGADLGGSGEAKSFSDVFTRFAIGSDAAGVNPRARLGELQSRAKEVTRSLDQVRAALKKIRGDISSAEQRPDECARLQRERDLLLAHRKELSDQLVELRAQEILLQRTVAFIPVRAQLLESETALGTLGPFPEEWRLVARSYDTIVMAHGEVQHQQRIVDDRGREFEDARAESGLPVMSLENHELSIAERRILLDAAQKVRSIDTRVSEGEMERQHLAAQLAERETSIGRMARVLGVEPETGASLLGRSVSIRSLLGDAGIWADDERTAAEHTAKVAGLRVRAQQAQSYGPPTSSGASVLSSRRLILALVGLVLAAASVLASPLLPFVIAVLTLVAVLLVPDRRTEPGALPDDPNESIKRDIADAEQELARIRTRCSERARALDSALGAVGASSVSEASLARTHVEQLADLAAQADQHELERTSLADLEVNLAELRAQAERARTDLAGLLRRRDIDTIPPVDEFSDWMEIYERAIDAARRRIRAIEELKTLESERDELIDPVIADLESLTWPARIDRIGAMREQLRQVEEQERRLQDSQLQIAVVGEDRDQIEEIIRSEGDVESLNARISELQEQIAKIEEARDDLLTKVTGIDGTIAGLEDTELLAELLAKRGELDETEVELLRDQEVLTRSATILGEVIDRFELENQDPLLRRTKQLIERVVPDWGDLIVRRNVKSEVVIERRTASARLDDSRLSDGARALLYLGLRLAFAFDDAERRGVALPILCDDPLVHLDDDRRPGAVRLLADAASTHQVVLFTCDTATSSLAQQNGAHVIKL